MGAGLGGCVVLKDFFDLFLSGIFRCAINVWLMDSMPEENSNRTRLIRLCESLHDVVFTRCDSAAAGCRESLFEI